VGLPSEIKSFGPSLILRPKGAGFIKFISVFTKKHSLLKGWIWGE